MRSIKKMLDVAFSMTFSDLSKEMGLSYDEAVLLKSRSEAMVSAKQRAKNLAKGPEAKKDTGTDQTFSRRKRCPIRSLMKKKKITPQDYHAALMIERGWRIRSKDVACKSMSFEPAISPSTRFTATERDVETEKRYSKWHKDMKASGLNVSLILDVVVGGASIRDAEKRACVRNGTGADQIVLGLKRYNQI